MIPNEEWGLIEKVAIVTGGGAAGDGIGNGRAAAILLARAGANVLVVDRDLTLADRTVEMTAAEGGNAVAASYDVTSSAQCAAMVKEAVSRWGALAVAAPSVPRVVAKPLAALSFRRASNGRS